MATNKVSETAGFLAVCAGGLDSLARDRSASNDKLGQKIVAHGVREFLDAFLLAITILPELPSLRRNEPISHAGVSGTSYHDVVCRIAWKQYETMFMCLDPESWQRFYKTPRQTCFFDFSGEEVSPDEVIENWPTIAGLLARLFREPVDGEFLEAGIVTERITDKKTDNRKKIPPHDVNDCARFIINHRGLEKQGKAHYKTKKDLILEAVGENNFNAMDRQLRRYRDSFPSLD